MGDMQLSNVLKFPGTVRRLPGAEPPPDFTKELCLVTARVRHAGFRHEVTALKVATKVLYAVAKIHNLEGLAWHADRIHDLDLADPESLPRLYELLDGLELALEKSLERYRYA